MVFVSMNSLNKIEKLTDLRTKIENKKSNFNMIREIIYFIGSNFRQCSVIGTPKIK